MYRSALLVVLIVATASARYLSRINRNQTGVLATCYQGQDPRSKCLGTGVNYPVMTSLDRARGLPVARRILLTDNTLDNLCSEVRQFLGCVNFELTTGSQECRELYASERGCNTADIDKMLSLVDLVCTNGFIASVKRNLDCALDMNLISNVSRCRLQNPNHNCSQFTSSRGSSVDATARRECFRERDRVNCNAGEVVGCAAVKVVSACGTEAGDLVTFAMNAFLERFPIYPMHCPGPV